MSPLKIGDNVEVLPDGTVVVSSTDGPATVTNLSITGIGSTVSVKVQRVGESDPEPLTGEDDVFNPEDLPKSITGVLKVIISPVGVSSIDLDDVVVTGEMCVKGETDTTPFAQCRVASNTLRYGLLFTTQNFTNILSVTF